MKLPKKDQWQYWGRWRDVGLFVSPWMDFIETRIGEALGIREAMHGDVMSLDGHFFVLRSDADYVTRRVVKAIDGEDDWFTTLFRVCDEETKRMETIAQSGSIEAFIHQMVESVSCSLLVHFSDHSLEPLLQKEAEKQRVAYSDVLAHIHPQQKTLLMKYHDELKRLDEKNIEQFAEQYRWIGIHGFKGEWLTPERVREEKKKLNMKSREKIEVDKQLPDKLQHMVDIGSQLAFQRSNIVEVVDKAGALLLPQIDEVAKQNGLSSQDIIQCTHDEISEILASRVIPPDLKKRRPYFGMIHYKKNWSVIFGPELDSMISVYEEQGHSVSDVHGQPAFLGKARGIAKIVISASEIGKLKEGDILIAPETTPDYIIGMRKAAAFVTNQGGITSHAAIVSRELKIPCVIGTQNATEVFKDGDMVDVDAEKGVVRKI